MARNRRRTRSRKARVQNSQTASASGAGGCGDFGARSTPATGTSHPLYSSRSQFAQARAWGRLYFTEWSARKIVNIPVQDMLREHWEYEGLDADSSKILRKSETAMGFTRTLRQALRMERLLGGSVVVLGVDGVEDVAEPLRFEDVQPGSLRFANAVPRTRVSNVDYDFDPFSRGYGTPEYFYINGQKVHRSHLLVFDGDPLVPTGARLDVGLMNAEYDGFGVSVLSPIFDDIMRATGSRQAAYQLIQRASVLLIANDGMQGMLEAKGGAAAQAKLQEIADQMSMYNAAQIDGKNVKLEQWSATFGSVPELMMNFLQVLSAASDIPATRFLGQAPGGLNATGDSDLENYYNMIGSQQQERVKPQLDKYTDLLVRSELPDVNPNDVEVTFPSLWNPSELEDSQVRTADATNILNAAGADIIDRDEARALLKENVEWDLTATDLGLDPNDRPDDAPDLAATLGNLKGLDTTGEEGL